MTTLEITQGSDGQTPALHLAGVNLHRGMITGAALVVVDVDGWDTPPPVKGGPEAQELADGDVPGPQFYASRVVTIEGVVAAKSIQERAQALRTISGLVRHQPVEMSVTSAGLTTTARVILSEFTHDPLTVRSTTTRYTLIVKAMDPYRYGAWNEGVTLPNNTLTGGLFHRGNAPSPPVVQVSGSAPTGYEIRMGNRYFHVISPVTPSQPHIVDFATSRAYVNGEPVSNYGGVFRLMIQPGMPQQMRVRAAGAEPGNVTGLVEVQDVWI